MQTNNQALYFPLRRVLTLEFKDVCTQSDGCSTRRGRGSLWTKPDVFSWAVQCSPSALQVSLRLPPESSLLALLRDLALSSSGAAWEPPDHPRRPQLHVLWVRGSRVVPAGRVGVILRRVSTVVGVLLLLLLFALVVVVGHRRRVVRLAVRVIAAVGHGLDWFEGRFGWVMSICHKKSQTLYKHWMLGSSKLSRFSLRKRRSMCERLALVVMKCYFEKVWF